ncbi:MAG: hypothetical protein U0Q18_22895 [Bryobacteraceae bacterium]
MPKKATEDNPLVTAAKVIGKAAGKVAAIAGPHAGPESAPAPQSAQRTRGTSTAKLQKKNRPHLPRKIKKAQKKMQPS